MDIKLLLAVVGLSYICFVIVSESFNPFAKTLSGLTRRRLRLGRQVAGSLLLSPLALMVYQPSGLVRSLAFCCAVALVPILYFLFQHWRRRYL